MKLELTKIEIQHFKGIKNRTETFSSTVNEISGRNGSGKSTIMNAFIWCFFGKDILDRKDYNIKPFNLEGEMLYDRPQCSVVVHVKKNGIPLVLKRVFCEKWQKKTGSIEEEFTGHETYFYIDSAPKPKREFDSFVESLFDEKIFKMLTNPHFFSKDTKEFAWTERRSILKSLITLPDDLEVCESLGDISGIDSLKEYISNGKSIEDIKAILAMSKKEYEQIKAEIPARIDEINQSLKPVLLTIVEAQHGKEEAEISLKNIQDKITFLENQSEEDLTKKQIKDAKNELELIIQEKIAFVNNEKAKEKVKIQSYNNTISNLESTIDSLTSSIKHNTKAFKDIEQNILENSAEKAEYLALYKELRDSKFEPEPFNPFEKESIEEFTCPVCNTPMNPEKYESTVKEMERVYVERCQKDNLKKQEEFNTKKAQKLEDYIQKGTRLKTIITELSAKKDSIESKLKSLEQDLVLANAELEKAKQPFIPATINLDEYDLKIEQINNKIIQLESSVVEIDNTSLEIYKNKKFALETNIKGFESVIADIAFNKSLEERKAKLDSEVKLVNSELLKIEALEYARQQFIRKGAELVDTKVNSMFEGVTFKLFEQQVNGAQKEVCKVLVDGVPFESANTAGQINAGLKIINTLSKCFEIYLPIWVDNAESVTNIQETESQQIRLKVSSK